MCREERRGERLRGQGFTRISINFSKNDTNKANENLAQFRERGCFVPGSGRTRVRNRNELTASQVKPAWLR